MQQTAVDPTTGTIDMDLIQTGISAGDRVARSHLTTELQALIESASLLSASMCPATAMCIATCQRMLYDQRLTKRAPLAAAHTDTVLPCRCSGRHVNDRAADTPERTEQRASR